MKSNLLQRFLSLYKISVVRPISILCPVCEMFPISQNNKMPLKQELTQGNLLVIARLLFDYNKISRKKDFYGIFLVLKLILFHLILPDALHLRNVLPQ